MPSIWQEEYDEIQELIEDIVDSNQDDIVEQAEETPLILPVLIETDRESVIESMDELNESILEKAAENAGGSEIEVEESVIERAKIVGAYFLLAGLLRGFNRIHGAVIARQIEEENRDEQIAKAVERAKQQSLFLAANELGQSYSDFFKSQAEAIEITQYRWIHSLLPNERPYHLARHEKLFDLGAPAGDEPGMAPNCRCWAEGVEDS